MNDAKNKAIIRARLAGGKTMAGVELNQPGKENAEGLLDTMVLMVSEGELIRENGLWTLPCNASVEWEGHEPIPTDEIAKICRGRPNMMVVIGGLGNRSCYLNTRVEDAIEFFKASHGEDNIDHEDCEVISFHDNFNAYEVW